MPKKPVDSIRPKEPAPISEGGLEDAQRNLGAKRLPDDEMAPDHANPRKISSEPLPEEDVAEDFGDRDFQDDELDRFNEDQFGEDTSPEDNDGQEGDQSEKGSDGETAGDSEEGEDQDQGTEASEEGGPGGPKTGAASSGEAAAGAEGAAATEGAAAAAGAAEGGAVVAGEASAAAGSSGGLLAGILGGGWIACVVIIIIILLLIGGLLIYTFLSGGGGGTYNGNVPTECGKNYGQLSTAQAKEVYGSSPSEVEKHLVDVTFLGQTVKFHEKAAPCLDGAMKEVVATNALGGYKLRNDGTYNWRMTSTGGSLSQHSFGIAIDFNAETNPHCDITSSGYVPIVDPLGICRRTPLSQIPTDLPPPFVEIMKKYGFGWGGDWKSSKDAMHFQWQGSPPPHSQTIQ